MATATPTIVIAGATAAGMRRARSSRISIVAADAGLGGDTVAIRSATIAVGPAQSWPFTRWKRSLRDSPRGRPPAAPLGLARPRAPVAVHVRPRHAGPGGGAARRRGGDGVRARDARPAAAGPGDARRAGRGGGLDRHAGGDRPRAQCR